MDEPVSTQRSPVMPIVIVAALVVIVSAAVFFFLTREGDVEFDPMAGAELVPQGTHLYIAFNTDFTSEPWIAIPRLLDALAIEDEVRDDLRGGSEEEGYDYDEDIVPALASIERLGFAAQYVSPDEGEWVFFADSRDRDRVALLLTGNEPDTAHTESRDEELGLDFDIYIEAGEGPEDAMVIAVDGGILYFSSDSQYISNFIRRQRDEPPLSESPRFQNAIAEVSADALIVGFGNGAVFDHRDFRDVIDAFDDSAEIDLRTTSLAFSMTARTDGFGARAVVNVDGGFGTVDQFVSEPADIDGLAALTPEDAIFFAAGAGLHDALVEVYANLEEQTPELLDLWVRPFEDATGVSVENDLIPVVGSSYGIAFGAEDISADAFDEDSIWFLTLLESSDPPVLAELLELVVDEIDFNCLCDSGLQVAERGGYATFEWPDRINVDGALADTDAFRQTLALLPADPSTLYFINLATLPQDVIDDASAELASDPDGYDIDLDALLGFAIAGSADDTSFSLEMVLPIAVAE